MKTFLKTALRFLTLFLTLSFLNSSCMKIPKMEEDFGTAVSASEVAEKMINSWGNTSLEQIKKADFLSTEKTLKISTLEPRLTLRKGVTVSELEDSTLSDQTPVRYVHMLIQSEEILEGQQTRLSTREKKLGYKKEAADRSVASENSISSHVLTEMARDLSLTLPLSSTQNTPQALQEKDLEDEIQLTPYEMFRGLVFLCTQKKVECYKLESEDVDEAVPEEIQRDPHCRGIPSCRWKLKRLQMVVLITNIDPESKAEIKSKAIIKLKISDQLPFLARLVEYCYEGIVTSQAQKFPVSICHTLKDFQRGL